MSETNPPLKATLKAGQGYDAPWLTVDATDPHDLANKLQALGQAGVHEALVEAANLLKAANNAAPLAPQGQEAQPQQAAPQQQYQSPWGAGAQQQQQAPAPQGGGLQNGTHHPTGQQCPQCGSVLLYKAFTSKAGRDIKMWACPNGRAKGDGHASEFVK